MYPETQDIRGILQFSSGEIGITGLGLRYGSSGAFTAIQTLSSDVDPDAPAQPTLTPSTLPGVSSTCSALEGGLVFANDGQYLGKITSNAFDVEFMGNEYGKYGSAFSTVSIFNSCGQYGG